MPGMLSGIRVLDFSRAVAGAYSSMLLGDLGAEVIKIEKVPEDEPPTLDPKSDDPDNWEGIPHFWALNRNKKGMCLDMKSEAGKQVLYELVPVSDIVFDNFRPRVLPDLGIDYETLKRHNPMIISCSISGFGSSGPVRDAPAFDIVAQAMGGAMSITGEPGRMPIRWGVPIGDLAPAIFAAFAMVSAVVNRDRTGTGQRLEVSMLDAQLALHGFRVPHVFGFGEEYGPSPRRSGGGQQVPYGPYPTHDGRWIVIAGGPIQYWRKLCSVVGREDLAADVRYDSRAKRQQHEEELSSLFEQIFKTKPADEWERLLVEAGVPASKVNTIREAFEHPQAVNQKMLIDIDHPAARRMKFAGNPIKVPTDPEAVKYGAAPALGQHTDVILGDLLGYGQAHLDSLRQQNVIWGPANELAYKRSLDRFA